MVYTWSLIPPGPDTSRSQNDTPPTQKKKQISYFFEEKDI
ncbi:MAG: hypothetical protein RI886_1222 [Pseudomonadota bacterium]